MAIANAPTQTAPDTHPAPRSGPSVRGRILAGIVRLVVKRWPRKSPESVLRWSRLLFDLPSFLSVGRTRGLTLTQVNEDGVRGEWLTPVGLSPHILLFLHGGGYVSCSPRSHRPITGTLARLLKQRVFSLDQRLAPEHPFPAAVDDASAAYQWLLKKGTRPDQISLAGDSGGGLVVATLLRLHRENVPLPSCAVCLCPWVDLTGTFAYRNGDSCAMFRPSDISNFAGLYLNGAPAETPEASPLFGDLTGLPPLLIQVSSSELLFDDARRLHEKAGQCGVKSKLSAYPGLPHVWHLAVGLIPEALAALREEVEFIRGEQKP